MADWLVRRRGYRSSFYCHTADPRASWPASVGKGLDVQVFGVGGVARESAVAWSRALERSLCYAYGCWEVLEKKRPRPIDLIVGRSTGLGSALFAPVYWPAAPVVNFLDYFYHAHHHDLADEAGPETAPAYFHWRRSMAAIDLLDLEQASLGWTPTHWQRDLFPAEYRDEFLVLHDGVDTRRFARSPWHADRHAARGPSPAGSFPTKRESSASWPGRSTAFAGSTGSWLLPTRLLRARADVLCVVVGDPIVRRGLDVEFHNRDYPAHLMAQQAPFDPDRLWFLGPSTPDVVAEVLAASDLHVAPSRSYPVARSLLEAMAAGCVVLASDTAPHREVIVPGQTGLLVDGRDTDGLARQALAVLDRPRPRIDRWGMPRRRWCASTMPRMSVCRGSPSGSPRWSPPGGKGRERSVHPRRFPRPVRPACPRADAAPRLAVQLPGAESFELPDPLARDARDARGAQGAPGGRASLERRHSLAPDLRTLPRAMPDGARRGARQAGLAPDLIVAHGGRGAPTLLLREVVDCPIIIYCEYYFANSHRDISYRIDLPPAEPAPFFPRCINAPTLATLVDCDAGYSATHWQKQSFPRRFHSKIEVHFDGIETELYHPGPRRGGLGKR